MQPIKFKTIQGDFIAVNVSEDAKNIVVATNVINEGCLTLIHKNKHSVSTWDKLPIGNYKLICTTKTVTEEKAFLIVQDYHIHPAKIKTLFKNYNFNTELIKPFESAIESFQSLYELLGLTGNYAILKQI